MNKKWMVMVALLLVFSGCASVRVSQDYDPQTAFDGWRFFRWAAAIQPKTGDPRIDNPFRDQRIRAAIERELANKGFVRSDAATDAYQVRYQYLLRPRLESGGSSSGIGFGFGNYGYAGGIAIGTGANIREYDQAMLIIDFLESQSDELLWRGTGAQRFIEYSDPVKTTRDIDRLVGKIIAQFPPVKHF